MLLCLASLASWAEPQTLTGKWYEGNSAWYFEGQGNPADGLVQVDWVAKTGGQYVFIGVVNVVDAQPVVIDFKNSSVIGTFRHRLFDSAGKLVSVAQGGISDTGLSRYALRHGRQFVLPPGHYRLVTELTAPFFLAQPQPYVDTEVHYRTAIRGGNALTLLCLGILLGLGFYYAALAVIRREATDALYCAFILGNLLYNGMALLVFPEYFDLHWFYTISVPILFSNCVYVLFVFRLLGITHAEHAGLYYAGSALLVVMMLFIPVANIHPNWSLELDRAGVGLFMSFGLVSGVLRARQGHRTARYYLIAVVSFFVLGGAAISLSEVDGLYTYYVEHLGLLAVTVEALLLALVVASQFAQLKRDFNREHEFAMHDELTGLRNRRAFLQSARVELERAHRYGRALAVIYIDLDNFKKLNDSRGHAVGDAALCAVGRALADALRSSDVLGRLGGDEFSIIVTEVDYAAAEQTAHKIFSIAKASLHDFAPVTVSMGAVWFARVDRSLEEMLNAADETMYQAKAHGKDNLHMRQVDTD